MYLFRKSTGFFVGGIVDLGPQAIGTHEQEASVHDDGEDGCEEETQFPAVDKRKDNAETTCENSTDEQGNLLPNGVFDGTDIFATLAANFPHRWSRTRPLPVQEGLGSISFSVASIGSSRSSSSSTEL